MRIRKNYKFKIKNNKLDNLNFLIRKENTYYFDTRLIGFACGQDIYNVIPINIMNKDNEIIISFEINGLNYLDGSSTTSKIEDDGSLLISSNTGYDLDDAIMDNVIEKYKGNIEVKIYTEYMTPAENSDYVDMYYYEDKKVKTNSLVYLDPNVRSCDYCGNELVDLINFFNED